MLDMLVLFWPAIRLEGEAHAILGEWLDQIPQELSRVRPTEH